MTALHPPTRASEPDENGVRHSEHNPGSLLAIVVSAVKATVKGGIGKLGERPHCESWKPGEPGRALSRPT